MSTPQGPICNAWVTGEQVAACGDELPGVGTDFTLLDPVAYDASWVLYELSGRQFPGVCEMTVRPCRTNVDCWGMPSSPIYGAWWWAYDSIAGWWSWMDMNQNRHCGCGATEEIRLAGTPIQDILEVKIDGTVVDPDTYRLDNQRMLVRLDDPGPPVVRRTWPSCQNITLPDTQPGTFSVTYTWGGDPPPMGQMAAAALARELWLACADGAECSLPAKVTKVVRQGVTYDIVTAYAKALREGASGLPLVDMFIATVNPSGRRRRSLIWSPDQRQFPRRVSS